MVIELYDTVKLTDGRVATIVEKLSEDDFLVDVGDSEKDWDTISVKKEQIAKVC